MALVCRYMVWRKAINFTFSSAARREKLRPRGNVYRPREFDRVFEHFHSSSNPSPVQGLPRSKRSNGVNSICWQSCAFWIRGKRPFKPLSKLPRPFSLFLLLSLSLSLPSEPNRTRTAYTRVSDAFANASRASYLYSFDFIIYFLSDNRRKGMLGYFSNLFTFVWINYYSTDFIPFLEMTKNKRRRRCYCRTIIIIFCYCILHNCYLIPKCN